MPNKARDNSIASHIQAIKRYGTDINQLDLIMPNIADVLAHLHKELIALRIRVDMLDNHTYEQE